MNCNASAYATYKVLSVPGIARTAEPSGPSELSISQILELQRNGSGQTVPGISYTAGNTPWGYGYIGTPPPIGSAAYGQLGTGIPANNVGYPTNIGYPTGGSTAGNGGSAGGSASVPYYPNTSQPVPGGTSVFNLVLWPKSVQRGGTVTVVWTSVNMAKDSCQVLFDGQEFAKSNEGSKPFRTVTSDPGTISFTLRCQHAQGQYKEQSASATIQ
jgi:hypothetical protein